MSELRHRDPFLFWIGAANLLALVVATLLSIGDQRLILGINPWIKPLKFYVSIAMFVWTIAWFMPETSSPNLRRTISRVIGFFLDRFRAPGRNLVLAVSILWLAVMGGLLVIALRGQPLLAL